jgi:hypothetical protein
MAMLFGHSSGFSQTDTLYLYPVIQLDSVVISDIASGFDVQSFIDMVQEDTGFYQSFRDLRTIQYRSNALARMLDKKGLSQASYANQSKQFQQAGCRWLSMQRESSTGDFFDSQGEMNYYTTKLFSYIFLYRDTICTNDASVSSAADPQLEKRKDQLKVLLFQPGQPVAGIPFVQHELGVFSESMMNYYDYDLEAVMYHAVPAYKFTIKKKPEVKDSKVVLQFMETWFNRSDFAIMGRTYHLKEDNLVFDFDVHMQVQIGLIDGKRVPTYIYYNGNWDAPGKRRESGSVQISMYK